VHLLGSVSQGTGADVPIEHRIAVSHYSRDLALETSQAAHSLELHALAHKLLVKHGCTAAPDGRVAAALRRVLEATGRINTGAGLDELLEAFTRHTIEITGAERACVVLVERENELRVRVAQGASDEASTLEVEDLSHTVIQRVMDSAEPLLLHDVFDDQELMGRPSITSMSLRSILCVPMLRGGTLYGVMYADSSSAAGSFDQVDLEVLSLFAEQAAASLETHRLVADLQNSMDELKAMQERLVKGERLRTIGELSSGVAHEFNNLLTSILARVQLIGLNQVDSELRRDLGTIEKACLDAAEVVRRLQTYAKQQRQGDFKPVDLCDICKDSMEFLRPLWATRRRHGRPPIHVELRSEPGLMARGNATELREVVTNLVKNALDALAGDGGTITITAARGAEDALVLRVQDDGPGIPDEIRPRVFDPFYTTKGERGTGLGLGLCQQIVERHGGDIRLDSTPAAGTSVTVALPACDEESLSQEHGEQAAHADRRMSVLVVDDDENVLGPLCRYLEREGFQVHGARNGSAALELVHSEHPDIVISDVGMPVMDGLEMCRALAQRAPKLPVVLMSGWADSADPPRARQAGAAALLSKPFALSEVRQLIEDVRARGVREDPARTGNA
jgi:signal transduction histidine kinase/ActR/RegA family two-component response regulator